MFSLPFQPKNGGTMKKPLGVFLFLLTVWSIRSSNCSDLHGICSKSPRWVIWTWMILTWMVEKLVVPSSGSLYLIGLVWVCRSWVEERKWSVGNPGDMMAFMKFWGCEKGNLFVFAEWDVDTFLLFSLVNQEQSIADGDTTPFVNL